MSRIGLFKNKSVPNQQTTQSNKDYINLRMSNLADENIYSSVTDPLLPYRPTAQQPIQQQPIVQPIIQQQPIVQQPIIQQQPIVQQPIIQQQPIVQQPIIQQQPIVHQQTIEQQPIVHQQTIEQQPIVHQQTIEQQPIHVYPIVHHQPDEYVVRNKVLEKLSVSKQMSQGKPCKAITIFAPIPEESKNDDFGVMYKTIKKRSKLAILAEVIFVLLLNIISLVRILIASQGEEALIIKYIVIIVSSIYMAFNIIYVKRCMLKKESGLNKASGSASAYKCVVLTQIAIVLFCWMIECCIVVYYGSYTTNELTHGYIMYVCIVSMAAALWWFIIIFIALLEICTSKINILNFKLNLRIALGLKFNNPAAV